MPKCNFYYDLPTLLLSQCYRQLVDCMVLLEAGALGKQNLMLEVQ